MNQPDVRISNEDNNFYFSISGKYITEMNIKITDMPIVKTNEEFKKMYKKYKRLEING